ncbi:MAG: hypothetical protein LBG97_00980 [Coriobacteriales bacterium]|nr:hypothetical protein [Coriobacteriales bacterium]
MLAGACAPQNENTQGAATANNAANNTANNTANNAATATGAATENNAANQSNSAASTSTQQSSDTNLEYTTNFVWAKDSNCGVCHKSEQASLEGGTTQASLHAKRGASCTTCHADETAMQKAHVGKTSSSKVPLRLRTTKVADSSCFSCHDSNHADAETLATLTTASTALVDKQGTTVNPHQLPANNDHNIFTCGSCHATHKDEDIGKYVKQQCVACHHENQFTCGDCHEI